MAPTGGTATKKRGRGRPRKEGASDAKRKRVRSPMGNGGSATATASYAAAQAQGMVAVSALNACLEHDSLAGAKALADKKALGMLKAAQEALLQKGFLVLHVDAPPSGFDAPLEKAGERLAKVRRRQRRLSRRLEYGAQLKLKASDEPALFHFLACVGRLVLKAASWALCPFSDPPPHVAAAADNGHGDGDEGGAPPDPFAGGGKHPLYTGAAAGEGRGKGGGGLAVDLEGEFLGAQPHPEDGDAARRCRSRLVAQRYAMEGSGPQVDVGLLSLSCLLGWGLEVEEEQEDSSSSFSADEDMASVDGGGGGDWRSVPSLSSPIFGQGGDRFSAEKEDVTPTPPFRILVTVGRTLERATAGIFKATARRVVLRGGDMVSPLEIALSLRARGEAVLNAVALCRRAPRFAAPGLMYPEMAAVESVRGYERRMGECEGEEEEEAEAGLGGVRRRRAVVIMEVVEVDDGNGGEGQEDGEEEDEEVVVVVAEGEEQRQHQGLGQLPPPPLQQEEQEEQQEVIVVDTQQPPPPTQPETPTPLSEGIKEAEQEEEESVEVEVEAVGCVRPRRQLVSPPKLAMKGDGGGGEEEGEGEGAAQWEAAAAQWEEDNRDGKEERSGGGDGDEDEEAMEGTESIAYATTAAAGPAAAPAAAAAPEEAAAPRQENAVQEEREREAATAAAPASVLSPPAPEQPQPPPPPQQQQQQPLPHNEAAPAAAPAATAADGAQPPSICLVVRAGPLLSRRQFKIAPSSLFKKLTRKYRNMHAEAPGGHNLPSAAFRFRVAGGDGRVLDPLVAVEAQGLEEGMELEVEVAEGL